MDFTSAFGTGCAAPIAGSDHSAVGPVQRFARRLGAALMIVALMPGAAPVSRLDVDVSSLRSAKGSLRFCLTGDPDNFPSCVDDKDALTRSIPASQRTISFDGLPHGNYALAVIHDENNNAKLDTMLGIPREGFGFSRNPPIGFGAPRFSAARFQIDDDASEQQVRMRYLL